MTFWVDQGAWNGLKGSRKAGDDNRSDECHVARGNELVHPNRRGIAVEFNISFG